MTCTNTFIQAMPPLRRQWSMPGGVTFSKKRCMKLQPQLFHDFLGGFLMEKYPIVCSTPSIMGSFMVDGSFTSIMENPFYTPTPHRWPPPWNVTPVATWAKDFVRNSW